MLYVLCFAFVHLYSFGAFEVFLAYVALCHRAYFGSRVVLAGPAGGLCWCYPLRFKFPHVFLQEAVLILLESTLVDDVRELVPRSRCLVFQLGSEWVVVLFEYFR